MPTASQKTELQQSTKPVTFKFLHKLIQKVSPEIGKASRDTAAAAVAPALQRLANLEFKVASLAIVLSRGQPDTAAKLEEVSKVFARLESLEARAAQAMVWKGVWRAGDGHQPGDTATHAGGLWLCTRATTDQPGRADSWKLIAKSHR